MTQAFSRLYELISSLWIIACTTHLCFTQVHFIIVSLQPLVLGYLKSTCISPLCSFYKWGRLYSIWGIIWMLFLLLLVFPLQCVFKHVVAPSPHYYFNIPSIFRVISKFNYIFLSGKWTCLFSVSVYTYYTDKLYVRIKRITKKYHEG